MMFDGIFIYYMITEGITDLGKVKKHIQDLGACKWNVKETGIKIFFDVTPVSSMIRPGSTDKSIFGVGISFAAMLTNKVLHAVNHVGFILSDGSIIHATTGKGVVRESGDDVVNNPRNYIIVNVGGSESDLINKFETLKKTLYTDKDSYDWKGIVRQFPIFGKLLARFKWSENKPYRFFCSELVANLLVRCGIIKFDELASIHEKLTGLDKYDEVDPTKLFLLVKDKAELCPVVCDADKNLKKENIMTKNELKQLVKEVLAEQNALTTLQISTVGGGTTLLLYRGDARQTERSSDKAYKTPTQFRDLIASLNTTGGMTTDEAIKNILKKLTPEQLKQLVREKIVVSDRVSEFLGEEASTKELQKLGFKPTKSDVNEVKGFVLHWNTPEADYMRRKSVMKPKMHSQFKRMMGTQTMKYDDLVKAFPNSKSIVLKDLPSIPRGGDLDYFTVDEEGDIVPIQQADISSGLD